MTKNSTPRRAALILAAAVFFTIFPATLVHAADETQAGDGLVINVVPRNALVQDATVLVTPLVTEYVFDVTVYDTHGNLFPTTQYSAVAEAVDGSAGHANCAASSSSMCVWSAGGSQAASPTFTVRVPIGAVNFMSDVATNGLHFFVVVFTDGQGNSLVNSKGALPTGSVSIAASALIARGDFASADQADTTTWSPVFLLNSQPRGLVTPGNPLVNPGFELGTNDGTEQVGPANYPPSVKVSFPGWYLRNYKADLPGSQNFTPSSTHFSTASNGVSGNYADVWYRSSDNGRSLALVQDVGAPNGQAWVGGASTEACFDARVGYASVSSFKLTANIFKTSGGSSVQTAGQAVADIPTDYTWRHYCLPFGSQMDGAAIREFYLNFAYGAPDAITKIGIDNVELHGFSLAQGVTVQNDLTDGFSVFIQPLGALPTESQGIVQPASPLAGGKSGFVYEVSAMDYTGGSAKPIDVAASPNFAFEILDQDAPTVSAPSHLFDAAGQNIFRFVGADGLVSQNLLVVAPSSISGANPGGVPWAFVQTPTDYVYQSTFGSASEPASGYYSPARNTLAQFSLADAMDYAATPVVFGDVGGSSLASAAKVTVACHGQIANTSCYNAASPAPVTLDYTFSTAGRVIETTQLHLVSASNPSLVLANATVTTPGAAASFTVLPAAINQLVATAHNYRVKIVSDAGTFVNAGASSVLDLANLAPTAKFTQSPGAGITRLTRVTLTDGSTDSDGSIASRVWNVTYTKPDTTVVLVAQGTQSTLSFTPPFVGVYDISLLVRDNAGTADTKTGTLSAANLAPKAGLTVASFSPLAAVVFTDKSVDPDGVIASREYSTDGGATWTAPALDGTYTVLPSADGPLSVSVRATDENGATSIATATTLVDGTMPATTLQIAPNATASGWFTGPVSYKVTRSDAGSGIANTVVVIDGVSSAVTGNSDITGKITGDGTHTIVVYSVDKAGNVESTVSNATVKIDSTAPSAGFSNPQFAGPIGGVYSAGENVTMDVVASDATSRVTSVIFSVNGAPVYEDTDATNGFSYNLDTTGFAPGVYQLQAIATNDAGLSTATESVEILVIPALV